MVSPAPPRESTEDHSSRRTGVFTVSLDFELYWGMRDKLDLDAYGANILGVRDATPRILDLFASHGIRATWATVGFLFFEEKDELLAHLPSLRPSYVRPRLSPYDHIALIGSNERKDPYHFGRSLIRRILECPGQEIGSHTFSHYYCLEPGQTLDEFKADLQAAHAAAQLLGIELRSLVFPRNQWRVDYLPACAASGIRTVRGNPDAWLYRADAGTALQRICRLADAYVNISGHHCHQPSPCNRNLIDVPASRFLRPFSSLLSPLDSLRLHRIRAGMKHAAEHGLIYHLWWHPHNFGSRLDANCAFLGAILVFFRQLSDEYGMASRAMGEFLEDAHA